MKKNIVVLLKGILLGLISMGIPGLSASTIGIIIGIYLMMVESIANIFKDFKKNGTFLAFLMIGYAIGAVLAAFTVNIIFEYFPLVMIMAIMGMLLGSLPDIFNSLKGNWKKPSNWIVFSMIVTFLILYSYLIVTNQSVEFDKNPSLIYLIVMAFIGLFTSSTFIIPGIDFAVVFLSLGLYYPFMNMLTEFLMFSSPDYLTNLIANVKILGFYLIGYLLGIFLFSKLIKFLSKKYESETNFASAAFVVAAPAVVVKSCIINNAGFYVTIPQFFVGGFIAILSFLAMVIITILSRTHALRYYYTSLHISKIKKFKNAIKNEEDNSIINYMNWILEDGKINFSANEFVFDTNKKYLICANKNGNFDMFAIIKATNSKISYDHNYFGKNMLECLKDDNSNIRVTFTEDNDYAQKIKECYLNGYEIVPAFIDCKNVYDKNSLKQVDASIDFKTSLTLKNEEFNDEIINKINYAIIM